MPALPQEVVMVCLLALGLRAPVWSSRAPKQAAVSRVVALLGMMQAAAVVSAGGGSGTR